MPNTQNTTTTESREERGLKIAALVRLRRNGKGWIVPSQTGTGSYAVDPEAGTCTCPDYASRQVKCKHLYAVEYTVTRETKRDGTTRLTKTVRVTYSQEWSAYNAAQVNEFERFMDLLRGLCDGVDQPPQTKGRPRLPLADVIYALSLKTYTTISGRRAMSIVRSAEARGFMDRAPHYNSSFRYLEADALTGLLVQLIEESARPLAAVESDFASDSTGFATNTYSRWFDHKWGKERSEQRWIKLHLTTGVKTNIITAALATAEESGDAPQLPGMVATTAETFAIREFSADKAYSSKRNLRAVAATGGMPYIPFKARTSGTSKKNGYDPLWHKLWHFYMFHQGEFLDHYHKRSNAESTVAMVKSKFGGSVRAKSPVAQVNEVLLKVLCHNLVVLVQSIYELELEPKFWGELPQKSTGCLKSALLV